MTLCQETTNKLNTVVPLSLLPLIILVLIKSPCMQTMRTIAQTQAQLQLDLLTHSRKWKLAL